MTRDVHHLEHWADGEETKLTNLVLLCTRHHTLVHEGGFRMIVDSDGTVCFQQPDGRVIPNVPATAKLTVDPVVSIQREHDGPGIEIDAWTATPAWHGERLDLEFAMMAMG